MQVGRGRRLALTASLRCPSHSCLPASGVSKLTTVRATRTSSCGAGCCQCTSAHCNHSPHAWACHACPAHGPPRGIAEQRRSCLVGPVVCLHHLHVLGRTWRGVGAVVLLSRAAQRHGHGGHWVVWSLCDSEPRQRHDLHTRVLHARQLAQRHILALRPSSRIDRAF